MNLSGLGKCWHHTDINDAEKLPEFLIRDMCGNSLHPALISRPSVLVAGQHQALATYTELCVKNSNFWWMKWVVELMQAVPTYSANFQVCMMGVSRDTWTCILAHFQEITAMSVSCDKSHSHAP